MGVNWYIQDGDGGRPKKDDRRKRPILLLFPGLGFGHNNLYTHAVAREAMKHGYKCGVAMLRCASDIPITSFKVSCCVSHDDAREIIDYVHQNYVLNSDNKRKETRLYAYGASLGAILLSQYLIHAKENSKLDGAGIYACPYDVKTGEEFFYTSHFGLYAWVIGYNLANVIH